MKILTKLVLVILVWTGISSLGKAQPDGEALFKKNCMVCHQIETRLVGPPLAGVTERLDEDWLIRFIRSSQTVIKSGDEYAVKLFEEYNRMIMPDQPTFTDEDIRAILAYIEEESAPKEVVEDTAKVTEPLENMAENFFAEEVKEGTRIFMGLKPPEKGGASCVSCHNVVITDTLNWYPSAMDLSKYSLLKSDEELLDIMNDPGSGKLAEVHKDYEITPEELTSIKAYLMNIAEVGMKEERPLPWRRLSFIIFSLLIVLSILDLAWTKYIRFRMIHGAVILISFITVGGILVQEAYAIAYQPGYAPDQPIKFSHKIHADQNNIECLYCHHSAEKSKSAGIPDADLCINCHKVVLNGPNSGSFEIAKIHHALNNNKPIEWVRIHNLPDHVYFNHAQHVNAGKLDCTECHGAVEEMHIAEQVSDLSMGWCLECHKSRRVQFVENEYYEMFETLHDDIKAGKIDSVTVADIGGTECQRCHY